MQSLVACPKKRLPRERGCGKQMSVDISDAGSRQFSTSNKLEYLLGVGNDDHGKPTQLIERFSDPRHIPERQFSNYERMHNDIATVEKLSQP